MSEIFEFFVNLGITEKEIKAGRIKIPKFELLRIEAMSGITKDEGFKKHLDNIRNHKPVIPADLCGELRSEKEFPYRYKLVEENHHFKKENDKFYRISQVYRLVINKKTNKIIKKELILDNHSEVLYDYKLIYK